MVGRLPSENFTRRFIRYYFDHLEDYNQIQPLISGFEKQGIDMDIFYWMDPQLEATEEDIRMVLKGHKIEPSELEEMVMKFNSR
jgi:hypothetical protein